MSTNKCQDFLRMIAGTQGTGRRERISCGIEWAQHEGEAQRVRSPCRGCDCLLSAYMEVGRSRCGLTPPLVGAEAAATQTLWRARQFAVGRNPLLVGVAAASFGAILVCLRLAMSLNPLLVGVAGGPISGRRCGTSRRGTCGICGVLFFRRARGIGSLSRLRRVCRSGRRRGLPSAGWTGGDL
jgi:hypothetical protein